MTKKYETLNGDPIETDEDGWFSQVDALVLAPSSLERLAEVGWIRERKLTIQSLAADLGHVAPHHITVGSTLGIVLQKIIDKGLAEQFLND